MANDADFYINALLVLLQQMKEKPVPRPSTMTRDKDLRRPQGRAQSQAVPQKNLKVLTLEKLTMMKTHAVALDVVEEEERQL